MLKLKNYNYELLYNKKVTKEYAVVLEKIKTGEKISILSDAMFKAMFQTEERLKYSCKFLSYFLNISYETLLDNIVLEKNELDKKNCNKKGLRCDYVANVNGTKINIEINNNTNLSTMERNIEYVLRLYSSKIKQGGDYEYTQVIQFNLNNFSFVGENKIFDIYTIGNNFGIMLTDKIIIVQIYIPILRKKWYNVGEKGLNEAEKYILGLVEPSIKDSLNLGKGNEIMEEYINDAKTASDDELLLEAYDKEWALKDEGKREGFQEGMESTKTKLVHNMLKAGLDINLISEITELSLESIEEIKQQEI